MPSPVFKDQPPGQTFRHNLIWDCSADDPVKFTKMPVPVKNKKPPKRSAKQEYYALCDLEDYDGNLGLSILRSSGGKLQNKMIVSRVTGGAALFWNEICAPEQVIKPGDHLVKVNDVRTSDDAWKSLPGTVALLTLRRPRVYNVRWRKNGKPLGLQVKEVAALSWGVRVCALDEGLAKDWNELNPSEAVLPSDVIVSINGIVDDPQQLEHLINSPSVEELDMTLYSWRRQIHKNKTDAELDETTSNTEGLTDIAEVDEEDCEIPDEANEIQWHERV